MATFPQSLLLATLSRLLLVLLCAASPIVLHAEDEHASPSALPGAPSSASLPASPSAPRLAAPMSSPEQLGDLYLAEHRYVAALDAYHSAPIHSAIVWNHLGMAYHHLFALDEARKNYEQALRLDPGYAEARNNLGAVFHGRKDFRQAEKQYKLALRSQPRMAVAWVNLGTTYFAERNYQAGAKAYRQALTLDPQIFAHANLIEEGATSQERISIHYAMARIYAQTGQSDAALAALRSAFSAGFKDRKRLLQDRELSSLRQTPEFQQLLMDSQP